MPPVPTVAVVAMPKEVKDEHGNENEKKKPVFGEPFHRTIGTYRFVGVGATSGRGCKSWRRASRC